MLSDELSKVEAALESSGDLANMHKIRQLRDKLHAGTFIVAFCGHFSAGKSTMINTLVGSKVLPSSPIPTSANVVTIERGAEQVRVFRKGGTSFDITVSELERLREYATDGDTVESIQIHFPTHFLPEQVQLMDTPGIDSTDDAHKLATESALHLADLVIYTMDYNHVQSEVNFGFTKTLHERGKAIWLVVNQVDKHNAFELSFADYQNSVRDSFAAWGIKPDGIFYTTMLDAEHPYNQFAQLQGAMQQLFQHRKRLQQASIVESAIHVIEEHGKFLASQNRPERERLLAAVADAGTDLSELQAHVDNLRREIDTQQSASVRLQQEMQRELLTLIENAKLTPFQTTELAGKYLESRRPGFRVGLLFSAAKTEQERSNRLHQLHADFTGKVSANLDWHIKDLLIKLPEKYGVRNEAFANSVYELKVDISPEMIAEWVKEGALSSQEYMYQYAKDISAEVKSRYKRLVMEYIERAVQLAATDTMEENEQLTVQLQQAEMHFSAAEALAKMEQQEQSAVAELLSLVRNEQEEAQEITDVYRSAAQSFNQQNEECAATLLEKPELGEPAERNDKAQLQRDVSAVPNHVDGSKANSKIALVATAGKLRKAAEEVKHLPGMHSISGVINARAERLEQNLFTVALFGAFSAGKSSFANAMMGDMLLPVSPNPTTATINKILPPTAEWPHGSARVKVKSIVDIAADIKASLAVFDVKVDLQDSGVTSGETKSFFDQVLPLIAALDPETVPPNAKPHFSFLKAVETGVADMQDRLGLELPVDMATFREYVAKEWKACFVEWIELYHDNPLTAQGIMLIDTPGADSINARHTKVAFEYIKNADAVLFVTYYNHAFSNADREFLIQLGRVKDAFELDKMFFLVNAADLAADAEELGDVVAHVHKNLIACGISAPQIYPVSSQLALLARLAEKGVLPTSAESAYRKLAGQSNSAGLSAPSNADLPVPNNAALPIPAAAVESSGILKFEQDFITFTIEELTQLAVQSGIAEIRRAMAALGEYIESAKQGEAVRADKRQKLGEALANAKSAVASVETESEQRAIRKEVDELMYYVQQRVFMRYIEAFNESFSSSVLRDDAGNIKNQLLNSLQDLLRFIAFDLAQEMRATAVRIEKQINQSLGRILLKTAEEVESVLPGCKLQSYENFSRQTPEFPEELPGVEAARFTAALSLYKNAKDFFERNSKAKMRDAIEMLLKEPVANYLKQGSEILIEVYIGAFHAEIDALRQRVTAETDEYTAGIAAALEMKVDVAELESTKAQLTMLLNN